MPAPSECGSHVTLPEISWNQALNQELTCAGECRRKTRKKMNVKNELQRSQLQNELAWLGKSLIDCVMKSVKIGDKFSRVIELNVTS